MADQEPRITPRKRWIVAGIAFPMVLVILVVVAVNTASKPRYDGLPPLADLDGKWRLVKMNGRLIDAEEDVSLDFVVGEFRGRLFCGEVDGRFEIVDRNTWTRSYGAPLTMCSLDEEFSEAFAGEGRREYKIVDGYFVVLDEEGTERLRFVPYFDD